MSALFFESCLLGLLGLLGILAPALAGVAQDEKPAVEGASPIPAEATQAARLKLVRELHRDDYARAKDGAAKLALSRRLLEEGCGTLDDPAGRYVLFVEARDLAVEAGDAAAAMEAVDEIARRYLEVNALDLKAQALERIGRAARTPEGNKGLTEACFGLAEVALRVNNHAVAKRVASLADTTAARSKSKNLAAWAAYLARQASDVEKESGAYRAALAVLRDKRKDPEASLTAGRYLALLKGEWDRGLPLLKQGSDAALAALAEKELAALQGAGDEQELGDLWGSAAAKLAAPYKARAQARAVAWHEKALGRLEGLTRKAVEDKLVRALTSSEEPKPGLVAELFEGRGLKRKKKVRIDPAIDFDFGYAAPDKDLPADRFSIRWTGAIRAPAPGKYALTFKVDDGVRFWIDGDLALDHWASGAHVREVSVYLTDRPHSLRVEYYEDNSPARISVAWLRAGASDSVLVPSYVFFHHGEDERKAKG
ncbi:MAG: hypothetical protein HY721_20495 [Planctomycetes bacterium]|nr:hypothetical protein [Planctomycetota bacterium]